MKVVERQNTGGSAAPVTAARRKTVQRDPAEPPMVASSAPAPAPSGAPGDAGMVVTDPPSTETGGASSTAPLRPADAAPAATAAEAENSRARARERQAVWVALSAARTDTAAADRALAKRCQALGFSAGKFWLNSAASGTVHGLSAARLLSAAGPIELLPDVTFWRAYARLTLGRWVAGDKVPWDEIGAALIRACYAAGPYRPDGAVMVAKRGRPSAASRHDDASVVPAGEGSDG